MTDCPDCKGTGVVPLFTSIAKCTACEVHFAREVDKMADPLGIKEKQKLISEYIKTPAGRAKLAASLTQPLRTRRDTNSVGRKAFDVNSLPKGALPEKTA